MEQQNPSSENIQNGATPQNGAAPQQPYAQQPYTQQPYAQQPYAQQPYGPNYAYGQPGNNPMQQATGWRRILGGIPWSAMFSSVIQMLVMNVIYRKLFNRR